MSLSLTADFSLVQCVVPNFESMTNRRNVYMCDENAGFLIVHRVERKEKTTGKSGVRWMMKKMR